MPVLPGLRPRRPARARERRRPAAAHRRAARPARGVRARRGRGELPLGRGLLREAPSRVPLSERALRRIAVRVPAEDAEQARAIMVELFPAGFEERVLDGEVELAAYGEDAAEARMRAEFGAGRRDGRSSPAGRTPGARSTGRSGSARLWVGPPWLEPEPGATAVVIDPGRAFGTGAHATTRLTPRAPAPACARRRCSTSAAARACSRSRRRSSGSRP